MSQAEGSASRPDQQTPSGWLSSRRALIRTATGLAAAGVVGSALADATGASAAATIGGAPGRGTAARNSAVPGSPEFSVTVRRRKSNNVTSSGYGYYYDVVTPHDVASGQPTGRRQHKPITITKEVDAASPLLYTIWSSDETVNVELDFSAPGGPAGQSTPYFTIKLTNAIVVSIEQYSNFNATGHQTADNSALLEDISFTFQKIEMT